MEYGIGNEKCPQNIYGIVHMTQENNHGKKDREEKENISEDRLTPPDQSKQKRQAGVARKEKVTAKSHPAYDTPGVNYYLRWERSNMGQSNKDRSNKEKQGHTFKDKGDFLWLQETSNRHHQKENQCAINESRGDIISTNIT